MKVYELVDWLREQVDQIEAIYNPDDEFDTMSDEALEISEIITGVQDF